MKFKEKDPIVSMEQWFPDKPLEYVKEVSSVCHTEYYYSIWPEYQKTVDTDDYVKAPLLTETFTNVREETTINLVLQILDNKKSYVTKWGKTETSCLQDEECLVVVQPSDHIVTYQSGRREVLTDKEKQERFE